MVPVAICGPRRVMGRALGWRPMAAAHCTVVLGRPVATAGLSYDDRDAFCAALQAEVRARSPPPAARRHAAKHARGL